MLVFIYGIWFKNICFYYDMFYIVDGYVFIGGIDMIGVRIYLLIGLNDGNV